jgi:hypothetical protein
MSGNGCLSMTTLLNGFTQITGEVIQSAVERARHLREQDRPEVAMLERNTPLGKV